MIVLSDKFYREILSHPIPTDLEAAKALSSSILASHHDLALVNLSQFSVFFKAP